MPLVEVAGNAGSASPLQIAATALNVGVITGLTVTANVVVVAHWPAAGVNVYVPEFVLLIAGAQVPLMLLVEVVGNTGVASPLQMAKIALKVGIVLALTLTVTLACDAHCPTV